MRRVQRPVAYVRRKRDDGMVHDVNKGPLVSYVTCKHKDTQGKAKREDKDKRNKRNGVRKKKAKREKFPRFPFRLHCQPRQPGQRRKKRRAECSGRRATGVWATSTYASSPLFFPIVTVLPSLGDRYRDRQTERKLAVGRESFLVSAEGEGLR